MNHDNVFAPSIGVLKRFTWLKEEFGLSSNHLIFTILRFSVGANWVPDNAVFVLSEDDDFLLLHKLLIGVNDMDIFNLLIDEPLLASSPFLSVEVNEIVDGSNMKGRDIV